MFKFISSILVVAFASASAFAQVVINEVHYHPVEIPNFDANGNPTFSGSGGAADFTDDVHEFVEIRNVGAASVDLSGWKLAGGIDYTFPTSASIAAGGLKVIAKNPARIQTVYSITGVLGPYVGKLSNKDDTVRLKDLADNTIDSVTYSRAFPWPTSADALGAGDDFTLLNSATYQYKGRSLQRVSASATTNDPANWLASPLSPGPSPGAANAVSRAVPKPLVVGFSAVQASDDAQSIRAGQQVRVTCTFSSSASLSAVQVESFVDAIDGVNAYSETRNTIAMTSLGNAQFTALLPGQPDRSVVRWRIRADRGDGLEQVFPRTDDALIVPVGPALREAWQSYFITPVRTTTRTAIYDVFISNSDPTNGAFNGLNGLAALNYNITGNPKRVTASANTGLPRDIPYVAPTAQLWNGSVPCIFVVDGVVRDAHLRYHGSRYNRSAGRKSFKVRFADTQLINDADSFFVTDKSDYFSVAQGLYINANLPMSEVNWVDWYLNGDAVISRLQQGEYNGDLLDKYHQRIADLNPGALKEETGEFLKDVGTIEDAGEGPYGHGSGRRLLAAGPWSSLQRYEWTFTLQNHGWKGAKPVKEFFDGLWTARGDTHTAPNPNITTLRAYLDAQLDVDTLLTSLSVLTWMCPWDDTTQNHFLWRRANGRWNHIAWDFDAMFGNGDTTGSNSWIYLGENGTPPGGILGNNFRGPNWFKDSVFKAYRTEYNDRLWVLNNTYLHPDNLKTLFFRNQNGNLVSYYSFINGVKANFCEERFASVNTQTGHAANGSDFLRPNKPALIAPIAGVTALPPLAFTTSAYAHTSGNSAGGNAHAKSKWEIRGSTGTYFAPVFVATSTTSLTSFAIPFDRLTFGLTYFWRVTYFDANDHPSFTSDEASFAYGPQAANQTLVSFSDTWKYDFSGAFTDATWAQPAFDDGAWASGQGTLAFENQGSIPETIRTTLPAPVTLSPSGRAYYFRKQFTVSANPATISNLRIRHLIDDGCVIWINGVKIHRYFMNEQASYAFNAFSNGNPGDGVYQFADAISNTAAWSWIDPRPYLVQGDNVIAVEVHQTNGTSSDITFGMEMTGMFPATPGDVVINEVFANGPGDWVEFKNTTGAAIDLSGSGLTDDILNPTRYVFPAGWIIPAGERRTIDCNGEAPASETNTGFGLDSGGQRLVLTSGGNIRDFVAFGPQARNYTIGRIPDGTGAFTLNTPTSSGANVAANASGSVSNLRFNEWMASPAHGDDWFEIFNADANPVSLAGLYLSDTPGSPKITQIPALSYVAGNGFADFRADGSNEGNNHTNFKLSAGGDNLVLTYGQTTIDSIAVTGVISNASRGRLPDGAASLQNFPLTESRGESNWLPSSIVINEALTHSLLPLVDFIELHNPTASAVDVGGWWLSDDQRERRKFQIPGGTIIPPGGYFVFDESQFGIGAAAFQLNSQGGDEVVLTANDGLGGETGLRSQLNLGVSAQDFAYGRVVTGNPAGSWKPEFWPLIARTPGAVNAPPLVTPVIINEVHYHPSDLAGAVDNARDEFIELHNPTTSSVNLTGWILKGGSDFAFAGGTILRPGDYILVVGFDPTTDPAALATFRSGLGVSASTLVYGPFSPRLPNDDADVEIARPSQEFAGYFVNVDKVRYADVSPWPTSPDGNGTSLQRASRSVIGNDPANWAALAPTPGGKNTNESAILDNDGDGMSNVFEEANGFDQFSVADALQDADGDGQSNLAEFIAGTDPRNGASFLTATVTRIAGGFRVRFTAQSDKGYTIQYRDNLTSGSWLRLTDIAPSISTQSVVFDDITAAARRFYRVVTPTAP